MPKTILLTRFEFGPTITKFLFFIMGISQTIQGISHLDDNPRTTGDIIFGSFLLLSGHSLIFLGFALFTPTIKFTPKISIDDEKIIVREEVFSRTKRFDWKDIKEITFQSFALTLLLKDDEEKLISLKASAEVSIEIKKLLREIADKKSVPVKGG